MYFVTRLVAWCTKLLKAVPLPALLEACGLSPLSVIVIKTNSGATLLADSLLFSGQRDNGMRYLFMPNDDPQNSSSIRFCFRAVFSNEKAHKRGSEHFVEHMTFDDFAAFSEGEQRKALQNTGRAFGAHSNPASPTLVQNCFFEGLVIMPKCRISNFWLGFIASVIIATISKIAAIPATAQPLLADPLVFSGTLENGMRYAVMPNDGPVDEASVRLYVGVGSLHEKDQERGFAHFVEHMAFNGSEAFPEGELIKTLQSAGLAFGAHANATTDFERTIYSLELPNVESDTIDTAFKVLRETASHLTFDAGAIERERGVLISELQSRSGIGLQVFQKNLQFWDPGMRAIERFAAGTEKTINSASRDDFLAFYQAFYRPENAFLLFVGDVEVEEVEAKLQAVFSDWINNTPMRDLAYMEDRLNDTPPPMAKVEAQEGIQSLLQLATVNAFDGRTDSTEWRLDRMKQAMANSILWRRVDTIARGADTPIRSARISYEPLFEDAMIGNLTLGTTDEKMLAAAALAEQEVRRALIHGFTEDELAEQLANFESSYRQQLASADKRPNANLANAILAHVHQKRVFIQPEDQLDIFLGLKRTLTTADLHETFRMMWEGERRFLALVNETSAVTDQTLAAALAQSRMVEVAAPVSNDTKAWAYEDFGTPGMVVRQEVDDKLDFTRLVFANNLKVNLARTTYEDNVIRMSLRFGGGRAAIPHELAGLENLAIYGFINGGLREHKVEDLNRLLAGKTASAVLKVGHDAYYMAAAIASQDLLTQLRLWTAFLSDAAFRPEAHGQFVRAMEAYFKTLKSSPGNAFNKNIAPYLFGTDARYTLPPLAALKALTMQDLENVLGDASSKGAMELVITGDFDEAAVIKALKGTLGALPDRREEPMSAISPRRITLPEDGEDLVITHAGGLDQAMLRVYWPTVGGADHELNAQLLLMTDVLEVMLLDRLREDEGLAYTPTVSKFAAHDLVENYGFVSISTDIGPSEIDAAKQIFADAVKDLAEGNFSDELFGRAKQPLLTRLRSEKDNNPYWVRTLSVAQRYPNSVEYAGAVLQLVEATDRQAVADVANTYLFEKPALTVRVVHEQSISSDQFVHNAAQ